MRKIKLILSLLLVLSAITCIIISAECPEGQHELGEWQYQGIGWDDYNNKFHEFTRECIHCDHIEYYKPECTGPGCIICSVWGN